MTLRETKKYLNQHLCNSKKILGIWDLYKWRYVELHTNYDYVDICYYIKEVVDKHAWIVFATERSDLLELSLYTSESEACAEFVKKIKSTYEDYWKE